MNKTNRLSTAHWVAITALVLSAVAVILQKMMGVTNYPPVPPAVVIALLAAAGLYFAPRSRVAAVIGVLIPLSLTIGPAINRWYEKLWQPSATGYPGIVLQWVAVIVAVIAASYVVYIVFSKKNNNAGK